MPYKTDQEAFWAGEFGTQYIDRNRDDALLASNLAFFANALRRSVSPANVIEFGSNIGMNLRALKLLYPEQVQVAVEINADAAAELRRSLPETQVHETSILNYEPEESYELALIKGVLIHIHPDMLPEVYDALVASSHRYILVAEYYNPSPVSIPYRGQADRLFKRDFAGEMMDRHPGLMLVDYGFSYRRDPSFPQDDITWFLMEKRS